MKELYISIQQLKLLENTIFWEIGKGELNAIIGTNKSGKTSLAKIICGQLNYNGIINKTINSADISFSDYTADNIRFQYSDFYYQQRYNVSDVADVEVMQQYLGYDATNPYHSNIFNKVLSSDILTKKLIELSSGESRKVLILKHLLKPSKIYIFDNPFTGLDTASAYIFAEVFKNITKRYDKTIILLLNDNSLAIDFHTTISLKNPQEVKDEQQLIEKQIIYNAPLTNFHIAFKISNGQVKAGNKVLIKNLSWTILKGEKWLLKGANGSGKSTLMSLLNADNPFAYSLGIKLFDKERGTGESVWEIKSKIGFVSPEIQLFWDGSQSVKDSIRSGFSNTLVLNRKIDEREEHIYEGLLRSLNLKTIENKLFGSLSSSEKRMVIVARALVNNPPLLILDEPFQGLDTNRYSFLYEFLSYYIDKSRTVIQIAHHEREVLPCINNVAQIENNILTILS